MLLGSTVLEVAIGLFFVYLLLSLLCSAAGEYIEAKLNNRAKFLRQGINLLLNDTTGAGADLAKRFYEHGLVRPLYRDAGKLPSYIPSRTFALALWNMASTAATTPQGGGLDGHASAGVTTDLRKIREAVATHLPNQELKTALLTLIDEADGDLERARKNIEDWYDDMMDRVSGWYKRQTSVILLVLGFGVAAAVNADTIGITKALARDGALRSSIVNAAEARLAMPLETPVPAAPGGASDAVRPATPAAPPAGASDAETRETAATAKLQDARASIDALGLPLGWVWATDANREDPRRTPTGPGEFLLKVFGVLLTGFAISQGAPFWFDLLNKFMVIRSTVKPSEKSQSQPSKDRPAPKTEIQKPPDEAEEPSKG